MDVRRFRKLLISSSKLGFAVGCTFLFILSVVILGAVAYSIVSDILNGKFSVFNMLDEVGLVIFSIAVFDVANYLMIEEVLKERERRPPRESRRALTKIALIIVTAVSLEGLVLAIEMAKSNVEKIIYPVLLLITATIFLIGLGIYQRLNLAAEKGSEKEKAPSKK